MRTCVSFCVVVIAACSDEQRPSEPVERCSVTVCGSNSPTIDHYSFHELNLDFIPNVQGFSLLGFTQGNDVYDLAVDGDRLIGHSPTLSKLTGQNLVGATIWIEHPNGKQYGIQIASVDWTSEVVAPFDILETYHFAWGRVQSNPLTGPVTGGAQIESPIVGGSQDLCPNTQEFPPSSHEWNEAANMPPFHSLVFEGDRINGVKRTVGEKFDDRWFNIGCAHDTLAKLRLTRHTMRKTNNDWKVSQTALKMLSADYCGDGTSFTLTGEPLVWQSPSGMSFLLSPTSLEARWDERGARCLDVPRAAITQNLALQRVFPDVEAAIAATCQRPPPCANSNPFSYDPFDKIVSGNYD